MKLTFLHDWLWLVQRVHKFRRVTFNNKNLVTIIRAYSTIFLLYESDPSHFMRHPFKVPQNGTFYNHLFSERGTHMIVYNSIRGKGILCKNSGSHPCLLSGTEWKRLREFFQHFFSPKGRLIKWLRPYKDKMFLNFGIHSNEDSNTDAT